MGLWVLIALIPISCKEEATPVPETDPIVRVERDLPEILESGDLA